MNDPRLVWKYREGNGSLVDDELVVEEPLEIRVRGRSVAVTMRTPAQGGQHDIQDAELAAGFLLSEGLIVSVDDIARIDPCVREASGNIINVFLVPGIEVDFARLSRNVFSSSSCGVCGKATLESLQQQYDPIHSDMQVSPDILCGLPLTLRNKQACFDRTGGLHAAGLFDASGQLLIVREDVGRHNAVDKVLGHALLKRTSPLDQHILLVSGRVSFEIVQKALAGGVPIVAAVSAPSSLAVDLATDAGMTLIGFLRDGRMNVYCGETRVISK